MATVERWAIECRESGKRYLAGSLLGWTKEEAIREYVGEAPYQSHWEKRWGACQANGDRAVKVQITWED